MTIVWLASYPKSGNTWMRAFLTNYLRDAPEPADINALEAMPIASSRELFERYTALESSDLTFDEIDVCRPDVYRQLARQHEAPYFVKVHDAYTLLADGQPLFPADATRCAIYIIRNPLDVAISGMSHFGVSSPASATIAMADPRAALCNSPRTLASQLRQQLGSWSDHVRSWVDTPKDFPVHVVRYEDMHACPLNTFSEVVRATGLPLTQARLEKALAFSSFKELKRQESTHGFQERPRHDRPFFRQGKSGTWRSQLSPETVDRIIADHAEVMTRFGYLTHEGDVVF